MTGSVIQASLKKSKRGYTDTRSASWEGGTCQLEALPPNVIAEILKVALWKHIDATKYLQDCEAEKADRTKITQLLLPAS